MSRWRQELLNNKWPNIRVEIALRKLFNVEDVTEQRNLATVVNKIKC
jgi:hypothetical protein